MISSEKKPRILMPITNAEIKMDSKLGPKEKKTLFILFIILVLDLLAFTCILPLFPSLMDFYAAKSHDDWLYSNVKSMLTKFRNFIGAPDVLRLNSVLFGGLLGSLFSLLQFVSSPLFGALSDVLGRKPVMLFAVCGSLCSYVVWANSGTFALFLFSRIIGGLSKANISVATALIADVCRVKQRGKGMAVIGVSFSVAFLIGPIIGAWFARQARLDQSSTFVYAPPAYFAITMTLLEIAAIWFLLPETLPKEERKTQLNEVWTKFSQYISPKSLFNFTPVEKTLTPKSNIAVRRLGSIYFIYLFLYSGLEFTLAFFTHLRFQYNGMQQGRMYFFTGLLMVMIQGGYVRKIPLENQCRAALWGIGLIIPAYIIIGLATNHILLYCGLALYALASGIVVPCLTTVVSSHASDSQKGAVLGVFRSLGALARAMGPILASANRLYVSIIWKETQEADFEVLPNMATYPAVGYVSIYGLMCLLPNMDIVFWCIGATACYIAGGLALILPYLLLHRLMKSETQTPIYMHSNGMTKHTRSTD